MRKIFTINVLFILLTCASSGQIHGARFMDSKYDFEVIFPDEYKLTMHGQQSVKRVEAMKWHGDMTIKRKPLFVVSVIDTNAKFIDVVHIKKNVHFKPEYYLSCEIEYEESEVLHGRNAYIVYYKGVAIEAAAAFIEFADYIIEVEYIVDADFFDDDELTEIIENISIITK